MLNHCKGLAPPGSLAWAPAPAWQHRSAGPPWPAPKSGPAGPGTPAGQSERACPHIEVPGQLLQQPDRLLLRHLRAPSLLLLQLLDALLQGLDHAPQHHRELLVVEGHELTAVQVLGFAHLFAQGPAGLHLLGDEADLVLASLDAVEHARLHGLEGLLELLLREVPDVRLQGAVAQVHEAVAEDQLSIVAAPNVRLDGQIGDAAGGVEAHELKQGVHLHAAAGERLELHQAVLRVAVQDQRRVPRGLVIELSRTV